MRGFMTEVEYHGKGNIVTWRRSRTARRLRESPVAASAVGSFVFAGQHAPHFHSRWPELIHF